MQTTPSSLAQCGRDKAPVTRLLPWPKKNRLKITPVFLPFLGCPKRCVFCSQDQQSGVSPLHDSRQLDRALGQYFQQLLECRNNGKHPPELAFYGGTFTMLPDWAWNKCLGWAKNILKQGLIASFRCSTRPDGLEPRRLEELARAGCQLVELGIQTYDDNCLKICQRGYSGQCAARAPEIVARHGLKCGIQLLPGLPGHEPEQFFRDMAQALSCQPACLRLYPCQVIDKTVLAGMWRKGDFKPWPLEQTIDALARAWLMAAKECVPIIRMGLAPQPELEAAFLAGPAHPALGALAMAKALQLAIEKMARALPKGQIALELPKGCQGFFWGDKGALRDKWASLGIHAHNASFHERDDIMLSCIPD